MSIEAHVFSPDSEPIGISELTTEMTGLHVVARLLRGFRDWSDFDLVDSGDLQDGDILCGWVTSDPVASGIEGAVRRRDRSAIERYLSEGNLGACGVGVRDISAVSPEDRAVLAELDGDDAFAKTIRTANVDYNAYSAAGRNDLSILLQFRLTQVIAKLRGGVWTDPVSGDHLVVVKGCRERSPCLVAFEEQNP